jgi:hypothetical protein
MAFALEHGIALSQPRAPGGPSERAFIIRRTVMTQQKIVHIETIALRGLMLGMAGIAVATGLMLLTTPLAIPVVVGMWISGAAMAWLGLWGRLPVAQE